MFNINSFKLTDKVAIITGGVSGLGEYYTRAMLTVGAKVMVVSHSERDWDKIKAVAAELGGQARLLRPKRHRRRRPAKDC